MVVVLPASIWAMIPMSRVRAIGIWLRLSLCRIGVKLSVRAQVRAGNRRNIVCKVGFGFSKDRDIWDETWRELDRTIDITGSGWYYIDFLWVGMIDIGVQNRTSIFSRLSRASIDQKNRGRVFRPYIPHLSPTNR